MARWTSTSSSSTAADHPVDFGAQARAFAALLQHWNLDRPHVVAHDFGGAVSLRATLFEQAIYSSLMLVDVDALPPYIHEAVLRAYIQNASHRGLAEEPDAGHLIQYDKPVVLANLIRSWLSRTRP